MPIKTNEDYVAFREQYLRESEETRKEMRTTLITNLYAEIKQMAIAVLYSKGGKREQPSSTHNEVLEKLYEMRGHDIIEQCEHLRQFMSYVLKMVSNTYKDKYKISEKFIQPSCPEDENYEQMKPLPPKEYSDDPLLPRLADEMEEVLKKLLTDEQIYLLMDLVYRQKLSYKEISKLLKDHPTPNAVGHRVRKLRAMLEKIAEVRELYDGLGR